MPLSCVGRACADWVSIKEEHLLAILESSSIQVDEVHVFAAAQRWGKEELRRRKLQGGDSPENLRAVLAKALKLVRFPTMKLDDIINTVSLLGGAHPMLAVSSTLFCCSSRLGAAVGCAVGRGEPGGSHLRKPTHAGTELG